MSYHVITWIKSRKVWAQSVNALPASKPRGQHWILPKCTVLAKGESRAWSPRFFMNLKKKRTTVLESFRGTILCDLQISCKWISFSKTFELKWRQGHAKFFNYESPNNSCHLLISRTLKKNFPIYLQLILSHNYASPRLAAFKPEIEIAWWILCNRLII